MDESGCYLPSVGEIFSGKHVLDEGNQLGRSLIDVYTMHGFIDNLFTHHLSVELNCSI